MGLVAFFAVWASATDAKRRRLPNRLLACMCTSALACQLLRTLGTPWLLHLPWLVALDAALPSPSACLSLTIALTVSLTLMETICRALTHKPGLGYGDIKLQACWTLALGTWSLYALILACATGALWALLHRERTFPMGPFITFWSITVMLYLSC